MPVVDAMQHVPSQPPSLENPFVGLNYLLVSWIAMARSQPPSLENPFVGQHDTAPFLELLIHVSTSKPGESLCGSSSAGGPKGPRSFRVSTSKPGESLCGKIDGYNGEKVTYTVSTSKPGESLCGRGPRAQGSRRSLSQPPSLENPFVGVRQEKHELASLQSQPPSLENPFVGRRRGR